MKNTSSTQNTLQVWNLPHGKKKSKHEAGAKSAASMNDNLLFFLFGW